MAAKKNTEEQQTAPVKQLTPEQQAERDALKEKREKARAYIYGAKPSAAWEELREAWPDLISALELLFPGTGLRRQRITRSGKAAHVRLAEALRERGEMTEMDIFSMFAIGRTEARNMLRTYLKNCAPDERVWAVNDREAGLWRVVGTGKDVPVGYVGYVPQSN